MSADSYFHWDFSPVIFTIPEIPLPFSLNITGVVLGIIAFFALSPFFKSFFNKEAVEAAKKNKKSKEADIELNWWQSLVAFAVCILLGQLVGALFNGPTFDSIGPISPRYYGMLFALAFVFGYFIGKKEFEDAGKSVILMENILMYLLISIVVGARLGHCLFYEPDYYLSHPFKILMIWEGGLASHGAALMGILFVFFFTRKRSDMSFFWLADRAFIPATLGGAFIRLGNFFNSEIIGKVTDAPWAVVFENRGPEPRHPSQMYEALSYFFIFGILWMVYKKYKGKPPEALISALYLISVFSARFLIEFTKTRQAAFATDWSLSMGQWLSVPIVLAGIIILVKFVKWPAKKA